MAAHAVLAKLHLSSGDFGTDDDVDSIHDLADQLAEAIDAANAGEFDGEEFGDGQCTFYMYGPDAKCHTCRPARLSAFRDLPTR